MSAEDNAHLVRNLYEAFNNHEFDRALAMATPDIEVVAHSLGHTFRGLEESRQFMEGWATAVPDGTVEVLTLLATDDGVATECGFQGTHTGSLVGPGGEIPPTGRAVDLHFCEVYNVQHGKITGFHNYQDSATLMQQLGLMPEPQQVGK
jgi:steroid delta-isomerase-like uncharacterized protein